MKDEYKVFYFIIIKTTVLITAGKMKYKVWVRHLRIRQLSVRDFHR